jgi:hypothetical protein
VSAGVQADKTAAAVPAKQRVRDAPGKVLAKVKDAAPAADAKPKPAAKTKPKAAEPVPDPPLKDNPDPVKPPDDGANTKKQAVADAAAAADRERITRLSNEIREAEQKGDVALAAKKKTAARNILLPYIPKKPDDTWDEVIERLDVSSPKDGAVFWSGDPKAAQRFAEKINGVTLETTAGGRIIDNWDVLDGYSWDSRYGDPPFVKDLWSGASQKYADGALGKVNVVQTHTKMWNTETLWHHVEKTTIQDKLMSGDVSAVNMYELNCSTGDFISLSKNHVKSLFKLEKTKPL